VDFLVAVVKLAAQEQEFTANGQLAGVGHEKGGLVKSHFKSKAVAVRLLT